MDLKEKDEYGKKNIVNPWRLKLYEIIFESDTIDGKNFDIALLFAIIFSVIAVTLESVKSIGNEYGNIFLFVEWFFTILFTIEYVLRIISVGKPVRYIFSFLGIVDLLAILPTYISLFLPNSQYFLVIRIIRLLRVFRIFKLARYIVESRILVLALKASRPKITVFLVTILSIVIIMGTLMYLIEGEQNGFTSIPRSVYWAIVTLTTVGYGDIAPKTILGQALASCIMIMGYGIIAVPTGIVTVELAQLKKEPLNISTCRQCSYEGHDIDAKYCKYCGAKITPVDNSQNKNT